MPFRGGPEALTEVMTGRVDFMCIGVSSGLPFVQEGKLLALAVSTPKRSAALPNVPTTLEAGFPDSDYTFWNGMLVPANTPRAIIDRLHQETQKALQLAGRAGKIRAAGNRTDAAVADGIRRADQQGNRRQYRLGQGGGIEVQLKKQPA